MTERDLQRVLTQSVQDVHLSDEARRNIRLATKEEKPVKSKKIVALVLALMLALSASVGIAAELGMFDYLARTFGQDVLPGANDLIREDVASGENDYATYRIKQAVYDGKSVALFTEIRPKDEHTLILSDGWSVDDPYGWLAYDTEEEAMADPRTIAEYAADSGMTRLVDVSVEIGNDSFGSDKWRDNVLTILYSARAEGDNLVLPIEYCAYDYATDTAQRVKDEITLKAVKPLWTVSSQETFDLPEFGIRVDGVTITGTVLQSYWTLDYTVTDLEKAQEAWNPDLLDMEGNYLPTGALGGGGGSLATELGQQLTWDSTFGAMENPPEQLLLLFRMWDESLYLKLPITLK